MEFDELMGLVGEAATFDTGLLLAGDVSAADVHRQLSRWTKAGRIHQLRRGLYALAPPWRKVVPHPFVVANVLEPGSCVSLQSALAWHGTIPEHVPLTTSVTSGRPGTRATPLGSFSFRHVKPDLMFGFSLETLGAGQRAWVASPEKALLDLVYLVPGSDDPSWLDELRLQRLEAIDSAMLLDAACRFGQSKVLRAAEQIAASVPRAVATP